MLPRPTARRFSLLLVLWTAGLAAALAAGRGRPLLVDGQVRADNGLPLRGDMMYTADPIAAPEHWFVKAKLKNDALFNWYVDSLHLNALRLCLYRYPMHYGDRAPMPGYVPNADRTAQVENSEDPDRTFSNQVVYDTTHLLALIDTFAHRCERHGMYLTIDYHPVYGIDTVDFYRFWGAVAPRYADRTYVFYEMANEPMKQPRPANFRNGYTGSRIPGEIPARPNYGHVSHEKGWMTGFQERGYRYIRRLAPETLVILCSFSGAPWLKSARPTMTEYVTSDLMKMPEFGSNGTWTAYAAIGWHGYDHPDDVPGFRDSVRVNANRWFPTLMTEHTLGLTSGVSTWDEISNAIRRDLLGDGGEQFGRGWEKGGHSWFIQTIAKHYGGDVYGNDTPATPTVGRVLISERLVTWPKDPLTR